MGQSLIVSIDPDDPVKNTEPTIVSIEPDKEPGLLADVKGFLSHLDEKNGLGKRKSVMDDPARAEVAKWNANKAPKPNDGFAPLSKEGYEQVRGAVAGGARPRDNDQGVLARAARDVELKNETKGQHEVELRSTIAKAQKTPRDRTTKEKFSDAGVAVAQGAATLGAGMTWLAKAGANENAKTEWLDDLQEKANSASKFWADKKSEPIKQQIQYLEDQEGFIDNMKALGKHPALIVDLIGQSAAMVIPGLGLSAIGGKAGQMAINTKLAKAAMAKAGMKAAVDLSAKGASFTELSAGIHAAQREVAKQIISNPATAAAILGEGMTSAAVTGQDVEQFVNKMDFDKLSENPRFVELATKMSPEAARKKLAMELSRPAALKAGTWTIFISKVTGAGKFMGSVGASTERLTAGGAVKGIAKSSVEEGMQNPGEDFVAYQGKVQVDPKQSFDPGASAAQGLGAGAGQGGGISAAGAISQSAASVWEQVTSGKVDAKNPVSQAAAFLHGKGAIQSPEQVQSLEKDINAIRSLGLDDTTYQSAMRGIVKKYLNQPALSTPSAQGQAPAQPTTATAGQTIGASEQLPTESPVQDQSLFTEREQPAPVEQDAQIENAQPQIENAPETSDVTQSSPNGVPIELPDVPKLPKEAQSPINAPGMPGTEQKSGLSEFVNSTPQEREAAAATLAEKATNRQKAKLKSAEQPVATMADGRIAVRGLPKEKVAAVRDKLGITGVVIGNNGNAIFPKDTNAIDLKRELGVDTGIPEGTILKNGRPFQKRSDALLTLNSDKALKKTHIIVPVEGGYGISPKAPPSASEVEAKTKKKEATAKKRSDLAKARGKVNYDNDSILAAVAKSGGLFLDDAQDISAIGKKAVRAPNGFGVFGRYLTHKKGLRADDLLTKLKGDGYLPEDADLNDMFERIGDEYLAGAPKHFSFHRDMSATADQAYREAQDEEEATDQAFAEDLAEEERDVFDGILDAFGESAVLAEDLTEEQLITYFGEDNDADRKTESSNQKSEPENQTGGEEGTNSKAETPERRKDAANRRRVSELTPEELRRELLTDPLTGLPNRRAYEESKQLPVQIALDVDSLKFVNDAMGHEAGDELLKTFADALRGLDAYHLSGDEFMVQIGSDDEAHAAMEGVQKQLDAAILVVTLPNGDTITKKGIHFSYGTGQTRQEADRNLAAHKTEREANGLRAGRGQQPNGYQVNPKGQQATQDNSTEKERVKSSKDKEAADEKMAADAVKKADDEKSIASRQESSSRNFQLGQSQEDAIAGQGEIGSAQTAGNIGDGDPGGRRSPLRQTAEHTANIDHRNGESNRIEDAGEKIGGARKDAWKERGLRASDLDNMSNTEAAGFATKDNVWPKIDYAKLIADGVEPKAAALIKVMRDRIAAKANKDTPEGRREYVEVLAIVAEKAKDIKTVEDASKLSRNVQLALGITEKTSPYSKEGRELLARLYSVYKGRKNPFYIGYQEGRKADEMLADGWPAKKEGAKRVNEDGEKIAPERPHLNKIERTGEDVRGGRNITAPDFINEFGFRGTEFGNWAAQDERQRSLNLAFEALHDLASVLGVPPKALSLNGTLGLAFGARGTRFAAHYEPGKLVINLAKLTGAGALAHEFGHALDHYFGEVGKSTAYEGSPSGISGWYKPPNGAQLLHLRHEMQDAFRGVLDAMFKRELTKAEAVRELELAIEKKEANLKAAERAIAGARNAKERRDWVRYSNDIKTRLNLNRARLLKITGEEKPKEGYGKVTSSYYESAKKLSGNSGERGYWARPTELFARAFEAYVFDKIKAGDRISQYLVQGVEADRYSDTEKYKANPYPASEEREKINAAFDKLFEVMESKETDKGIALFNTPAEYGDIGNAAPLYSQLAQAFETAKQDSMAASTWKAWLVSNAPKLGVKKDEITWSGITDFLDLHNKAKISKADILNFLSEEGVKVKTTVLGGEPQDFPRSYEDLSSMAQNVVDKFDSGHLNTVEFQEELNKFGYRADFGMGGELEQIYRTKAGEPAKFFNYVPPGGVPGTYREILITLPERISGRTLKLTKTKYGWKVLDENGKNVLSKLYMERAEAEQAAERITGESAGNFRSAHFAQPNILVHLRTDEATGADGKRYLRVIEVQSDWGQKGRDDGFGGRIASEIEAELSSVTRERSALLEEAARLPDGQMEKFKKLNARIKELGEKASALDKEFNDAIGKTRIPTAPFVTDTKAWVSLGIKKAIQQAVGNGVDGVIFASGQQNADLYDLSKKINELTWYESHGKYELSADGNVLAENVPVEKLNEYIGKDLAARIQKESESKDRNTYSGLDLKVGGEGMRHFYDVIVPSVANEVLKKAGGGKVEDITVGDSVNKGFLISDSTRATIQKDGLALFNAPAGYSDGTTRSAYERRIDELFGGQKPAFRGVKVLDRADVLGMLGMDAGPVFLVESKVRNGAYNHNLTVAHWKKIPDWLDNPAMVFDSDTVPGRLVMLAPEQLDGNPIVMVLEPANHGAGINLLVNAYDKSSGKIPLNRWVDEGLLRYYDKKRSPAILARSGLQLPRLAQARSLNGKIYRDTDLVKYRLGDANTNGFALSNRKAGYKENNGQIDLYERLEQRPGTTGLQRYTGRIAIREVLSPFARRAEGALLGSRIDKDFREHGGTELIGQTVRTGEDLALLAQILRDPRFETFRIFFTKNDQIIGHSGFTSRMPGMVQVVSQRPGESESDANKRFVMLVRDIMKNSDADGFWVLHNHPNGRAIPSGPDIGITKFIASKIPGFRGHVIIDHNEYGYIDAQGIPEIIQKNMGATRGGPELPHDMLNSNLGSPSDLVALAGKIKRKEGFFTLISRGHDAKVSAIAEFPLSLLSADKAKLLASLRRFARMTGSQDVFAVAPESFIRKFDDAVAAGWIEDAVADNARRTSHATVKKSRSLWDTGKARAMSANQKTHEYRSQNQLNLPGTPIQNRYEIRNKGNINMPVPAAQGKRIEVSKETKRDSLARGLQDKYRRLKTIQADVLRSGGKIEERSNPYLMEEIHHSKTALRLKNIDKNLFKPLEEAIVAARKKHAVTLKGIQEFLIALHAKERNEWVRSFDKENQSGSGMSDADAEAVIEKAKKNGSHDALMKISAATQKINEHNLNSLVEDHLEPAEYVEHLKRWKNYVPLKTVDENGIPGTGQGFSIGGKEFKRALGRHSEAGDVLENLMLQTERLAIRAEKNKVEQAFMNMVFDNPDPKLWTIEKTKYKRAIDKETGELTLRPDFGARNQDDVLSVKVSGETYLITVHDEKLVRAMKNLSQTQKQEIVDKVLSVASSINRYYALVYTALSPEFVVSNMARDLQTAFINMTADHSTKLAAKVIKDIPAAIRGSYRGIRDKAVTTEYQKWFLEYEVAGGKVEFFGLNDIAERRRHLDRLIKRADGSILLNSWDAAKAGLDYIMDLNGAVENATRVSVYANLRQAGYSKAQSASFAKNITVNFNRKGELGVFLNALYLFYNAATQGVARFAKTATSKRGAALLALTAIAGLALDALMRNIAPDDEDGKNPYDKALDAYGSRYVIIMRPDGSHYKWIMPYQYSLPFVVGQQLGAMANGQAPGKTFRKIIEAAITSFNPVGGADIAQAATPTIADPLMMMATNTGPFGNPLYPESDDPDSEAYFRSNTPESVRAARWLNSVTGGNEVRSGAIDIHPATIDLWFRTVTGGLGSMALNFRNLNEDSHPSKVPFLKLVYGKTPEWYDQKTYYENINELKTIKKELDLYANNEEKLSKIEANPKSSIVDLPRSFEREIKKINKEIKALRADESMDDDERNDQLKMLDAERRSVMREFNLEFNRAR